MPGLRYSEKEILATEAGKLPANISLLQGGERPQKKRLRPQEPVDRMTGLEKSFLYYWRLCGGNPEDWLYGQHPFMDRPRMHLDFTHRHKSIAVEIDGGQWQKRSGHNSGVGVQRDAEKLALCNKYKITLYRFTTSMVCYEEILKLYKEIET